MGKFSRIHHYISKEDLKRVHEQKVRAKKLESERIEEEKEEIKAEFEQLKSDWRNELRESDFTNITKGNKVGQTFQHVSGATITLDGALGGKMMVPSQVTLDLGFGEKITVDGPAESDFALTGFTKPLDLKVMQRQNVKTAKEINDQLDASIKVSDVDTAKVDIGEDDLGYKSTDEILADVGDQWTYDEYMAMLDAIADKAAAAEEPIAKAIAEYSPTGSTPGDVPISLIDAQEAITNARNKAEQALHQAWERYNKVPDLPSVPDEVGDTGKKHAPILNVFNNAPRSVRAPLKLFAGYLTNTIKGNAAQVLDQKDINSAWENTYIDVDNNSLSVDGYMQNVFGGESLSQLSLDGNTAKLKFGFKPHINAKEFAQHPDQYNFLQKQVINSLGPYVADLQVGPGILKPIGGVIASKATEISKMLGGGKNLEGEITMSMSKLKKINPDVYNYLIKKKKVNESTAFSKIKKFRNK